MILRSTARGGGVSLGPGLAPPPPPGAREMKLRERVGREGKGVQMNGPGSRTAAAARRAPRRRRCTRPCWRRRGWSAPTSRWSPPRPPHSTWSISVNHKENNNKSLLFLYALNTSNLAARWHYLPLWLGALQEYVVITLACLGYFTSSIGVYVDFFLLNY